MDNNAIISEAMISPNMNSLDISTTSGSSSSFFDRFKNISTTTWVIIIIVILAFLGLNIFVYLAKGTQDIVNIFEPLFKKVFGISILAIGGVVDVTAEGAKTVINTTATVLDTGLTKIQDLTPEAHMREKKAQENQVKSSNAPSSVQGQPVSQNMSQEDIMQSNTLNKALNTSAGQDHPNENDYQADESTSNIQTGGAKSGWCYIGEDRGFRTCAQLGHDDVCMSGNIFPSQELCINPSLRS